MPKTNFPRVHAVSRFPETDTHHLFQTQDSMEELHEEFQDAILDRGWFAAPRIGSDNLQPNDFAKEIDTLNLSK